MSTFVGLVFKWKIQIWSGEVSILGKELFVIIATVHVAVVRWIHLVRCS